MISVNLPADIVRAHLCIANKDPVRFFLNGIHIKCTSSGVTIESLDGMIALVQQFGRNDQIFRPDTQKDGSLGELIYNAPDELEPVSVLIRHKELFKAIRANVKYVSIHISLNGLEVSCVTRGCSNDGNPPIPIPLPLVDYKYPDLTRVYRGFGTDIPKEITVRSVPLGSTIVSSMSKAIDYLTGPGSYTPIVYHSREGGKTALVPVISGISSKYNIGHCFFTVGIYQLGEETLSVWYSRMQDHLKGL